MVISWMPSTENCDQPSVLIVPSGRMRKAPLWPDVWPRMTESVAICQYLASLHAPTPLNVERGEAGYGAYPNWLHFGETSLTSPLTLVLRYTLLEPEDRRQSQAAQDYAQFFAVRLRALEQRLEAQ